MSGDARLDFQLNGQPVEVPDLGLSLLEVLRDQLGRIEVKDGCSPQGQCGCCTVLVDGAPRVSCVTPARRIRGRSVTTVEGIEPQRRDLWADAMFATGGSQCGFCTPGIICRLEGAAAKGADLTDRGTVDKALLGHLCRCTGWLPIREAAALVAQGATQPDDRDVAAASRRAELEGGAPQRVGPSVAIGRSGFADDLASRDSLVALPSGDSWIVAESISEARAAMGKVQGRRSSVVPTPPIELPAGPWAAALQTCWTEPAYLEPDAVYCEPGGVPVGPLTNGGAFGAKVDDHLRAVAAELATQHGRPVRVLYDREDVVRRGAKRPPLALGLRPDMSGVLRVAATPGVEGLVAAIAPGVVVEPVEVSGPPTSTQIRGAIRAELEMAMAAIRDDHEVTVTLDSGAWCRAGVDSDGVHLVVSAGAPLDPVVLRSYTIGAAHQALGFVGSEALAVDSQGEVQDLTIRSFGVLRAVDTSPIHVDIVNSDAAPVAVGEAVFCAVASAAWAQAGRPQAIPVSAAT